jgi:hypothetical protein
MSSNESLALIEGGGRKKHLFLRLHLVVCIDFDYGRPLVTEKGIGVDGSKDGDKITNHLLQLEHSSRLTLSCLCGHCC